MANRFGTALDLLTSFTRRLDDIPTGNLDVFADGLKGTSGIDVGIIKDSFKNDEFLKTLASSGGISDTNKISLFKKLAAVDDPGINDAIKRAATNDETFKAVLRRTDLSPEQFQKLGIEVPTPATTIDAATDAATDAGEAIEAAMESAVALNPNAATKLESSATELAKVSEQLSSLDATLKNKFFNARADAIAGVKNSDGLEKLADLEAEKLRMLKNDAAYARAFDIFGKLTKYGIGGGVAYFAWLQYKKVIQGNEDEILCKMTCLPYNWDSSIAAGFGGSIELGDSSLGYRYLEGKPQSPQSPDDVVIDESKNTDWDWDTQPLCKKAGTPNCDEYCSRRCGEVHDPVLPFEVILGEAGKSLGEGVNALFDGLGLGDLGAGVKTLIISIFGIIVIGLILFLIYKMISAQ